jgi:excisionase family DNA binding protein
MPSAATMPAARVRLTEAGLTPRGLSQAEAAAYLGVSAKTFRRQVKAGRLPGPMPLSSRRRVWDRAALDAHLDRASDVGTGDREDEIMRAIRGAP